MSVRRSQIQGEPKSDLVRRSAQSGSVSKKSLVALASLIFLVASIALGCSSEPTTPSAGGGMPVGEADRVEVVCFHRTQHCAACLWAAQVSRLTVETYFRDELASGRVTFREVDVQRPENASLVRKYRASGSSLFVNYIKNGVDYIQEATGTYPFVGNQARFAGTLRAKIEAGLGGRR